MIEYLDGPQNWNHLIDTIVKNTSLPIVREDCERMISQSLEKCVEVWKDKIIIGYALIINISGWRTFHGYKLVPGNSITAFRVARRILNASPTLQIMTTTDKKDVIRLANLLGLRNSETRGNLICLKK